MELINIKGGTYLIKGGTNTGVYIYNNNKAIIIDPGLGGTRPKRIINMLKDKGIDLNFIINTHEHNDHYGACSQFKEDNDNIKILSSAYSKLYIEKPELFSKYIIGGKTNGFMEGKLKNKTTDKIIVDKVVDEGIVNLGGIDIDIIEFKGHTPGSIGILTPDKVLFVGDLLVGEDILEKFDFLFLYDIKEQLDSLKKLEEVGFEYLVLGHSKKTISKDESYELILKHNLCINKYISQIKRELNTPITLEKLLKNIIISNNLKYNYKEYYFFKTSLVSVISYLEEKNEIDYLLKDGDLLYYTKIK